MRFAQLYYQWFLYVKRRFGTKMLYLAFIVVAQIIKAQAVFRRVYDFLKFMLYGAAQCSVHNAFENRVLHALPVVYTDFGYFSKPLFTFISFRIYIICYKYKQI